MFLSLRGVAAYTGLSENTLKAYSQRGYMPAPDVEIGTGEKVTANGWSTDTIDHWLANRPGRGARTDLKKTPRPNRKSAKNGSKNPEIPDTKKLPRLDSNQQPADYTLMQIEAYLLVA